MIVKKANIHDLSATFGWDITTLSILQNKDISLNDNYPNQCCFRDDGLKFYYMGNQYKKILEFDLSIAWDISTLTYLRSSISLSDQSYATEGLAFKPDGKKVYMSGRTSDSLHEYNLATAWDISTISHVRDKSIVTYSSNPTSVTFNNTGTKFYTTSSSKTIQEYDLSTPWDISTLSYRQNSGDPFTNPMNGLFFRDDGLKMYSTSLADDNVYEFDLSVAWNISTLSLVNQKSVANEDTDPQYITFKTDGLKMYLMGDANNKIFEYDLT